MSPQNRYRARHALLFLLLAVTVAPLAWPQELEFSVSPSPVGAGARAGGMANAFVAVADDATAASWNPAGLVQLERPEASLVLAYDRLCEELDFKEQTGGSGRYLSGGGSVNFLSVAAPFPWLVLGKRVVLALSYQRKYDFDRDFTLKRARTEAGPFGSVLHECRKLRFAQDGGLATVTPSIAVELTPRLALGMSVHLWGGEELGGNAWEQRIERDGLSLFGTSLGYDRSIWREEYRDFSGESASIGLLWSISPQVRAGIRYDGGFEAEADYRSTAKSWQWLLPVGGDFRLPRKLPTAKSWERRHIRFPDTWAFGLAWQPNDRWTLALDYVLTHWGDFWVKDDAGRKFSLVDYSPLHHPFRKSDIDSTQTLRFGFEHLFIPARPGDTLDRLWSVRGGAFYDEEPATGKPDRFWGLTCGFGVLLNQGVNIDLAYQLRYGNGVNHDFVRGLDRFEEDVVQHRVLLSTVVYF